MKITNFATLRALLEGDLENALISEMPGGIEAQEASEQKNFVNSETLPKEFNSPRENGWSVLESFGVTRLEDADDIFVYVRLPIGWKKVPTDHSMWSNLIDDKGRKRASIFYKGAFYDRSAFLNLERRYSYSVCPIDGWDNVRTSKWHSVATDCDTVIWHSSSIDPEPDWDESADEEMSKWMRRKSVLSDRAIDWLLEHYPDWKNPAAYWD